HRARGTEVGVQVQGLAEAHVDAPEARADGRRDRALERDLVAPDGLQDTLREWRALARDGRLAGLLDLPFEGDAGRVEDASRRLRQLRPDAVAGDERDSVGHGRILGSAPIRAAGARGERR